MCRAPQGRPRCAPVPRARHSASGAAGTRPRACLPALCHTAAVPPARHSHNARREHPGAEALPLAPIRKRWVEVAPPEPGVPATPGSVPARSHRPRKPRSRRVRGGAGDAGGAAAPAFRFPRWPPRAGPALLPPAPRRAGGQAAIAEETLCGDTPGRPPARPLASPRCESLRREHLLSSS